MVVSNNSMVEYESLSSLLRPDTLKYPWAEKGITKHQPSNLSTCQGVIRSNKKNWFENFILVLSSVKYSAVCLLLGGGAGGGAGPSGLSDPISAGRLSSK